MNQLRKNIKELILHWDEVSMFELKGVQELTKADLDVLEIYALTYERRGNLSTLLKPLGKIKEVLEAYGIS